MTVVDESSELLGRHRMITTDEDWELTERCKADKSCGNALTQSFALLKRLRLDVVKWKRKGKNEFNVNPHYVIRITRVWATLLLCFHAFAARRFVPKLSMRVKACDCNLTTTYVIKHASASQGEENSKCL